MKWIRIVVQVILLYMVFLLGEAIAQFFNLIIPGSIIGLLLLLTGLILGVVPIELIEDGARALLLFLPLFFVPATVGIVQYPEFLSGKGLLMIAIVVVSTCISLAGAGWASRFFEAKKANRGIE